MKTEKGPGIFFHRETETYVSDPVGSIFAGGFTRLGEDGDDGAAPPGSEASAYSSEPSEFDRWLVNRLTGTEWI